MPRILPGASWSCGGGEGAGGVDEVIGSGEAAARRAWRARSRCARDTEGKKWLWGARGVSSGPVDAPGDETSAMISAREARPDDSRRAGRARRAPPAGDGGKAEAMRAGSGLVVSREATRGVRGWRRWVSKGGRGGGRGGGGRLGGRRGEGGWSCVGERIECTLGGLMTAGCSSARLSIALGAASRRGMGGAKAPRSLEALVARRGVGRGTAVCECAGPRSPAVRVVRRRERRLMGSTRRERGASCQRGQGRPCRARLVPLSLRPLSRTLLPSLAAALSPMRLLALVPRLSLLERSSILLQLKRRVRVAGDEASSDPERTPFSPHLSFIEAWTAVPRFNPRPHLLSS